MRSVMKTCDCSENAMERFEGLYFDNMVGSIHEYYRFYSNTTPEMRLKQIAKVAADRDVRHTKLRNMCGIKDKIICILL